MTTHKITFVHNVAAPDTDVRGTRSPMTSLSFPVTSPSPENCGEFYGELGGPYCFPGMKISSTLKENKFTSLAKVCVLLFITENKVEIEGKRKKSE